MLMLGMDIDVIIVDDNDMGISNIHIVLMTMEEDIPVLDHIPNTEMDALSLGKNTSLLEEAIDNGLVSSLYLYTEDKNYYIDGATILRRSDITNEMISHARMMGMASPIIRNVLLREEWYNWYFLHVAAVMNYKKSIDDQLSLNSNLDNRS